MNASISVLKTDDITAARIRDVPSKTYDWGAVEEWTSAQVRVGPDLLITMSLAHAVQLRDALDARIREYEAAKAAESVPVTADA